MTAVRSSAAGRADRRAQVLAAAAQLFRQRGYAQVGVDDIGAEVGFSGPAVYRYFPGKQAMVVQLGIDFLERVRETAAGAVDRHAVVLEAALRDPDGLYALVRFAEVMATDPDGVVLAGRSTFDAGWDEVLPSLDDAGLDRRRRMRMRALAGVFLHVALVGRVSLALRRQVGLSAAAAVLDSPLSRVGHGAEPGTPRTRLRHVTRREDLLAVATRLMGERGYTSVSLTDIGAEAGVSASAVMRHFDSKENLLSAAVARAGEQVAGGIATALRLAGSAEEAVAGIAAMYARYVVECRDSVVIFATESYALSGAAGEARRQRHRMYVSELAHVVGLATPRWSVDECHLRAGAAYALMNELVISRAVALESGDIAAVQALAMAVLTPVDDEAH
ncbi:hypothetical protein GCM10009836_52660 [Pseudonocardia ailaonensis]|uniref:HTH tetR-type domain-containing protein n=1 Tax=Pseudonocardia ailaonensis TaxID=367279 RepID=A0ABN2NEI9_9PSEU